MTCAWLRYSLGGALCVASLWLGSVANASGLQVAPTTLSLQPAQNADGLWLNNTGTDVVHAQVRVYHWTQDANGDHLSPSRGLIISPPMLQLAAGEHQLIRVIRVGAPPNGPGAVEDAYRLAIDELPVKKPGAQGLQFVLHYSLPIFIEPMTPSVAPPQLQWSMHVSDNGVMLQVANHGARNAQLAQLNYVNASGVRTEITPGLLGYVLPGCTMHWIVKLPAEVVSAGGTVEALINGEKVKQNLSLDDRAS